MFTVTLVELEVLCFAAVLPKNVKNPPAPRRCSIIILAVISSQVKKTARHLQSPRCCPPWRPRSLPPPPSPLRPQVPLQPRPPSPPPQWLPPPLPFHRRHLRLPSPELQSIKSGMQVNYWCTAVYSNGWILLFYMWDCVFASGIKHNLCRRSLVRHLSPKPKLTPSAVGAIIWPRQMIAACNYESHLQLQQIAAAAVTVDRHSARSARCTWSADHPQDP